MSILLPLTLIITTTITGIILYYKWSFQYWKRKGVPSAEASVPFGSLKNPLIEPESLGQLYKRLYKKYKVKGYKHIGVFIFTRAIYVPIDLEIVRSILLKDFNHFVNRGFYYNEKDDPLSAHLFALEGAKWKNLRAKLSPALTSGKMKSFFSLILDNALQLKEAINEACLSGDKIDAKIMMGNYTADVIGSTAFGLDCNSFKNPNSEYRKQSLRFFQYTKFEAAKFMMFVNNHELGRFFRYCITPQEVRDFFMKTVSETVNYRETTNFKRNDFMQILIDLKNNSDPSLRITFQELAAQAFVFFVAATETSATVSSFCIYELAMNQEVQEKIRNEVVSVLQNYGGEMTYESLSEMKYTQQVIDETLRKYPAGPLLFRRCVEDYKIPGTNIILEKGTDVAVPVIGLHHEEDFYPDHETFNPDRFSDANKAKIPSYCYLPFGEGPRICIGVRFAVMQIKAGIAMLLKSFKFSLHENTPTSLKLSPYSFVLISADDIFLNVEKID